MDEQRILKVEVKKVSDPRIKATGVRYHRSYILMMKAIAKEKDMAVSALYNQIVGDYLKANRPKA